MMVEPAPFDIYLCDNCDAELYSREAIVEHEKTCNVDADDVILCDTPEPERQTQEPHVNLARNTQIRGETNELRNRFLLNFNLQCHEQAPFKLSNVTVKQPTDSTVSQSHDEKGSGSAPQLSATAVERRRRMTRRNRAVQSLTRCPTIPLSSPAGQLLLRTTMPCTTPEYLAERLERMERFCHAPIITKAVTKPKFLEKRYVANCTNCTFKKPAEYSAHMYVFPRRQFAQRRRAEDFLVLNLSLIRRCRPISVRLKKLPPDQDSKRLLKRSAPTTTTTTTTTNAISNSSAAGSTLNIKLTRDTTRSSNWKIKNPASEVIVDTIDLCSSDEQEEPDEKAGTTRNSLNYVRTRLKRQSTIGPESKSVGQPLPPPPPPPPLPLPPPSSSTSSSAAALSTVSPAPTTTQLLAITPQISENTRNLTVSLTNRNNGMSTTRRRASCVERPAQQTESETAFSQSFHPSVYMLPNCTTTIASPNDDSEVSLPLSKSGHNRQQNHQLIRGRDVVIKRLSNNNNVAAAANWFGSAALNAASSAVTATSNQLAHADDGIIDTAANQCINNHVEACTSPNLNLMQNFGSPNRIISIDLTS